MARLISFSLNLPEVKARRKIVTRRFGWWDLQPGTVLHGVDAEIRKVCAIRVVSVRAEPLHCLVEDPAYGQRECVLEGFSELTPEQYVALRAGGKGSDIICNRIYFEYLDEETGGIDEKIRQQIWKETGAKDRKETGYGR